MLKDVFLLIIIIVRLTPVYKDYASRAMFITSIVDMLTGKSGLKQNKIMESAEKS